MTSTPVKVGDRAPLFTLPNQADIPIQLETFIGKKPIVLFFYPKDDTPACSAESCAFRDRYAVFQESGAEVIGISADSPASHAQFARKYNLPFTLLSDTQNEVRKLYGVPATFFILPGRVTYIIDRSGIIQHIFDSPLNIEGHVQEALDALKRIG